MLKRAWAIEGWFSRLSFELKDIGCEVLGDLPRRMFCEKRNIAITRYSRWDGK
jgi:hypothetical protein